MRKKGKRLSILDKERKSKKFYLGSNTIFMVLYEFVWVI